MLCNTTTNIQEIMKPEVKQIPEIYKYLTEYKTYEKVFDYNPGSSSEWDVTHSSQEQVGSYWIDVELWAKWSDESGEMEMVEFGIEDVVVYKNGEQIFDREDCVPFMNNPMFPTYGKEVVHQLEEVFRQAS